MNINKVFDFLFSARFVGKFVIWVWVIFFFAFGLMVISAKTDRGKLTHADTSDLIVLDREFMHRAKEMDELLDVIQTRVKKIEARVNEIKRLKYEESRNQKVGE